MFGADVVSFFVTVKKLIICNVMHDKDNNSNNDGTQSTGQYSWLIVFILFLGLSDRIGKKYHARRKRAKLPCIFCKYEQKGDGTDILYEVISHLNERSAKSTVFYFPTIFKIFRCNNTCTLCNVRKNYLLIFFLI